MSVNKIWSILLISICTWSCVQMEVKLPVNGIAGIQEPIYDNTQIWMFYETADGEPGLRLNKNNKITGTNWIFNIDKRLPFYLVAPALEQLIEGRKVLEEKSDKPAVFNYFSYVDSLSEKMSTIKFNRVKYRTVNEFPVIDQPIDSVNTSLNIALKETGLTVNNQAMTPNDLAQFLTKYTGTLPVVDMYIHGRIPYGEYIEIKAILAPYQPIDDTTLTTENIVKQ